MHILIILVNTVTDIYNMVGKFWSLKFQPMSHFQVKSRAIVVGREYTIIVLTIIKI